MDCYSLYKTLAEKKSPPTKCLREKVGQEAWPKDVRIWTLVDPGRGVNSAAEDPLKRMSWQQL